MMFREKSISKLYAFALAAVFAIALAGCGGGGGGTTTPVDPGPMPDPQMECEDAGGRYNADGTCTSAAELVMERQAAQRSAISTAIGAATTAVNAVDNDSTDAEVSAADTAVANARTAIAAGADLSAEEKAANTGTVDVLASQLSGAKTARQMAIDDANDAAKMAMMATAMKLHDGISMPGGTGDDTRSAAYGTGDNANDIAVTIGTAAAVNLSEDKDATVAAQYGWTGMRFTAEPDGDAGTYEAMVYSNVGEPTEGAKFNDSANGGYTLNADDQIADVTSVTDYAGLVASPSFDQSAGTKTFDLAENREYLEFDGTFNGVDGTYTCTPTAIATDRDTCGSTVAASGFTLIGGTWTFEPDDPEARLMNVADDTYASYGWWIHKSEDGETFTASAFAEDRGTVTAASGITALRGTAMYMGGAAGKYALRSMTGGTNDAGHFTARATLEADFNADTITGIIDNFMGADGESRDWSVELKESAISDIGAITGTAADAAAGNQMTVWTMGGSAADASGEWSGDLKDNGDDGVPKIGTGTFYTLFGLDGKMVGAFGVNKQ